MNILVVAPTPFFSHRGTHIRIFEEVKLLVRRGHRATIATYHIGEDPDFGDFASSVSIKRIHRLLFWYKKKEAGPNWQKIILDILLLNKIIWLLIKDDYDVIHAHLHEGIAVSWLAKKILFWKRIKIVGDFHGDLVGEMVDHGYLKIGIVKKIFKIGESFIYKLSDRIITSSPALADQIITHVPHTPIVCIPDGGEVLASPSIEKTNQLKKDLGISEGTKLVVYTGGFTEDKGIHHFLNALEHPFIESIDNLVVCLAGFPYERIAQQVINHPLTHKIIVLDQFNSRCLSELFSLTTVAVDPKDDQGFQASGKLVRYILAGLPVVCFGTEVNRVYLGDNFPFVEFKDQGSFALSLVRLVNDDLFRKRTIEQVKSCIPRFSTDYLAEVIEYEYKQLCPQ
jgi:glycosyltransferase involved in cell wall biosynthesis